MLSTLTIRGQICPSGCAPDPQASRRGVVIHSRVEQRLRCTRCGVTWVMRRGELAYRLRSPQTQVEFALRQLAEGQSIRRTAAALQVSPTTIVRWLQRRRRSS